MATTIIDTFSNRMSDYRYFAKSKRYSVPDAGTYGVIRVPRNALVTDVWVLIDTAFAPITATLTVGYIGNGESENLSGFLTNLIADPYTTGMKRAQHDTLTSFEGKYFSSTAGGIVATVTGTLTAGVFYIFADYVIIR
jgi:hypothetical protein